MIQLTAASSQHLASVATETPTTSGTIAFWIVTGTVTGTQYLFYETTAFRAYLNTTGNIVYNLHKASGQPATSTGALASNTRYHVALSYGPTAGDGWVYINAALDSSTTGKGSAVATAQTLYIGSQAGANYLTAQIEDFRIFDRVLSIDEIATIYNVPGSMKMFPIRRWTMNEGAKGSTVSTVYDYQGVNNLAAAGSPVYTESYLRPRRPVKTLG